MFGALFVHLVYQPHMRLSLFTGLEYWATGLSYFPFLDKFLCLFIERSLNQQVAS